MNEACDRCGPAVRSVYRAVGGGELYLCRHCANQLWSALSAQGWTMWPVAESDRVPQPTRHLFSWRRASLTQPSWPTLRMVSSTGLLFST
jgi:hypothetical protein